VRHNRSLAFAMAASTRNRHAETAAQHRRDLRLGRPSAPSAVIPFKASGFKVRESCVSPMLVGCQCTTEQPISPLPWRLNTVRRTTVRASSPSRTWLSMCGAREELRFDPIAATDKADGGVNVRQRDPGGNQCCAVDGPRGDGVDRSGKGVL
jgi:hypothetical protein